MRTATRERLKMEKEPAHLSREQSDPGRSDLRSARAAQGWGRWSSTNPEKPYAALRPNVLSQINRECGGLFIGCVRLCDLEGYRRVKSERLARAAMSDVA